MLKHLQRAADLTEVGSFISHSFAVLLDLNLHHLQSTFIAPQGENSQASSAGAPAGTYCFFKGMLWMEAASAGSSLANNCKQHV